LLKPWWCCRSW